MVCITQATALGALLLGSALASVSTNTTLRGSSHADVPLQAELEPGCCMPPCAKCGIGVPMQFFKCCQGDCPKHEHWWSANPTCPGICPVGASAQAQGLAERTPTSWEPAPSPSARSASSPQSGAGAVRADVGQLSESTPSPGEEHAEPAAEEGVGRRLAPCCISHGKECGSGVLGDLDCCPGSRCFKNHWYEHNLCRPDKSVPLVTAAVSQWSPEQTPVSAEPTPHPTWEQGLAEGLESELQAEEVAAGPAPSPAF